MSSSLIVYSAKRKPTKSIEAVDVAARYFLYKLHDASRGSPSAWHSVRQFDELQATVRQAVQNGWVTVRAEGKGRAQELFASLTDEGRIVARKGLR